MCVIPAYFQMVKLQQPRNETNYNFKVNAIFAGRKSKHFTIWEKKRMKIVNNITTTKEIYPGITKGLQVLWNGSRLNMK